MMVLFRKVVLAAGVGAAVVFGAPAVMAQEISQSHLEAANRAARSAPAIGDFDGLLPFLSEQVQNRLIRTRPDLFREIAEVVSGQALELSIRRTELGNDVARIWARRFTEDELNQIAGFFGSETGAKYKEIVPEIGEQMVRASRSWSSRVSEELYERSLEEMKRRGHDL